MKTYYKPDLTKDDRLKPKHILSFETQTKDDYLQITEFDFRTLFLLLKYKMKGNKVFLYITPIGDDFSQQHVEFFTLLK